MAEPVYRTRNEADLKDFEEARKAFLEDHFDTDGMARHPDHALADAIGMLMDRTIDRDCDSDRRIIPMVYDPRQYEAFIVRYRDPRSDEAGKSTIDTMRMSDERLCANRGLAFRIIEKASRIIQLGAHEAEPGMPRLAAELPDIRHFDAALAVVEQRIAHLGILTSDGDGWPETDESLETDIRRAFGHLRFMFPGTAPYQLELRDRARHEDIIMVPCGDRIGLAELRSARYAIADAARLLTMPAERSNQLDGIYREELRQAEEEAERRLKRAELRREIGTLPGIFDGMSDRVSARVRDWIEADRHFPVYRDRKPGSDRDMLIDELESRWGQEVVGILPKAMLRPGMEGLVAMQTLCRLLGLRFGTAKENLDM